MTRMAWGAGFTTLAADGTTLDAWFRWLGWGELGEEAPEEVDVALAGGDRTDDVRRVTIRPIRLTIDVDAPPTSAADAYLRLHLLSHRLAAPAHAQPRRHLRLSWPRWRGPTSARSHRPTSTTSASPLRREGRTLVVRGLDKFPPMTDYVIPAGVRIADAVAGAPRRPPRRRHRRHARGLLQLQRRHARHVDGRGPHQPGRRRRRRLRHRRRRLDHGHAVRRWHRAGHDRRALPPRRQRRHRDQPRRRLRGRGRPLRHRRHAGAAARRRGRQGQGSCRASAA